MKSDNNLKILALIPARSGSKSVPHKNIRPVAGKPLLAHSIGHAQASRFINRIVVSTDSPEYAAIARQYGAETPFLRPAEISGDASTDLEAFTHALNWLAENEGYVPDICVHLRPTYPVRNPEDIDNMIKLLLDDPAADAVRSVAPAPETPYKMWFMGKNNRLEPVLRTDIQEAYNLPRQALPAVYLQNGCIDVVRTGVITEGKSMTGKVIRGYLMEENFDIDEEHQLRRAEQELWRQQAVTDRKTFCFDIDGVIATVAPDIKYDLAEPQPETISLINELHKRGHRIVIFTARGTMTGIDWGEVTRHQLAAWGVSYHELVFGKPAADYHIDDKNASPEEILALIAAGEL